MGPGHHRSQGAVQPRVVLSHFIIPGPQNCPFPPETAHLLDLEMAVNGLQKIPEQAIFRGMYHLSLFRHDTHRLAKHITQIKKLPFKCHAYEVLSNQSVANHLAKLMPLNFLANPMLQASHLNFCQRTHSGGGQEREKGKAYALCIEFISMGILACVGSSLGENHLCIPNSANITWQP